MKAVSYSQAGPAAQVLSIGDMPTPAPAAGEVLVRIAASGVNPSDVKLRGGTRASDGGKLPYPRIVPHSDGAGTIEAVGAGVPASRVGERVWLWNGQWGRALGTAADHIVLPAAQAVPLPETTSFAEGACLGIPAMTAHRCVYADGPVEGKTVLVTGGAGAVGFYAVQMARLGGARVIATVSNPQKAERALSGGAEHVVNYRETDVAEAVGELTGGQGVDRVIDVEFGGNLPATVKIIRRNGVVATYGSVAVPKPELPFYDFLFKDITLRTVLVYLLPEAARQQAIDGINGFLKAGKLRHAVARTFPMDQVVQAHELVESNTKLGCVVVDIP